jgi:hypothetical protein
MIEGRRLQVAPLTPGDLAMARAWIKERTEDPFLYAKRNLDGLSEAVQVAIMSKAWDDRREWGSLSSSDAKAWSNSVDGQAFWMWRSLVKYDATVTHEWCFDQIRNLMPNELNAILSSIDVVSKSDGGHVEKKATIPTTKTMRKKLKKAGGRRSTSASRNGSGGPRK